MTTTTVTTISTDQVRRVGNIVGIAIVERLDRIVQLLEAGQRPMVVTVTGKTARSVDAHNNAEVDGG